MSIKQAGFDASWLVSGYSSWNLNSSLTLELAQQSNFAPALHALHTSHEATYTIGHHMLTGGIEATL